MRLLDFLLQFARPAAPASAQEPESSDAAAVEPELPEGIERQVFLNFQEGKSDKVYHLALIREGDLYKVYFEYGRRGTQLQTGFKTPDPVSLEAAEKAFNALLNEKTKKGYQPYEGPGASQPAKTRKNNPVARKKAILEHLALAVRNPAAQADKNWPINRVVWRAGELRIAEALPHLAALLQKPPITQNAALMQYCTLWAIARCGMTADESQKYTVRPVLQQLAETRCDAFLYLVCTEIMPAAEQMVMQENLLRQLPPSFQHQVRSQQGHELLLTLQDYVNNRPKSQFGFVEMLYALSVQHTFLRPAVLWFAGHAPFRPHFFKVLRHLFKMAEMRLDAPVFGALTQRFAAEAPMFTSPEADGVLKMQVEGLWHTVKPDKELPKENSLLAFSSKTRSWFLRRSLQTLLDTLEYEDQTYVKMATGILLALDDERHNSQLYTSSRFVYNEKTKNWDHLQTIFPRYGEYPAIFYILNGAYPHYKLVKKGTAWAVPDQHYSKQIGSTPFEPHPERWESCPQAYIHLMAESRAEVVQAFALRRFRAHPHSAYLSAHFDENLLRQLINSPWLPTAQFALELIEQRFDPQNPDRELVLVMLDNRHPEVRAKGHQWLRANLSAFVQDTTFVLQLLTHDLADIRLKTQQIMREIVEMLDNNRREALFGRIIVWLMSLTPEKLSVQPAENQNETPEERAAEMITWLHRWGTELMSRLSLEVLEQFLYHPLEPLAFLGAKLLAGRPRDPEHLPDRLLQALLGNKSESGRAFGTHVIELSQAEDLRARQELLFQNIASKYEPVRKVIHPALLKVMEHDPAFAEPLLGACLHVLLRKEPAAGIHEEILGFVREHLDVQLPKIERKTIFRLLNSDQIAANTLAAHLVERFVTAESLSIPNIVRLGNHEVAAVRQVCQRMFLENKDRMRYEREEAVRLLESDWEDIRAFGFDYFRMHFGEREWTPELLISVCDSVRQEVQAFGREMTARYLRDEDGPEFLLQLSQHPRPEVQGYAAQYLEKYAGGNPESVSQLSAYCTTVLMQVNKSRRAKNLVFDYLRREALQSAPAAREVIAILDRVSLTAVQDDKAQCIRLLHDVHEKYPDLAMPESIILS